MLTLPTAPPTSLTAGDTVAWLRALPNYPRSQGWQLKYTLVNAGAVYPFEAIAGETADDFEVLVQPADSAMWTPGDYTLQEYVVGADGSRQTLGTTRVSVTPNLAAATSGVDTRSQARRIFEAISATLEGRASEAELDVQVNGRQIKYIPVADLLALRNAMRQELANEDRANGGPNLSKLYARFVS